MQGWPSSTWTMVPSWILLCSPIEIGAMSPRRTAVNQTLDSLASVTSPKTTAPGATNAVGWIFGIDDRSAFGRIEGELGPAFDRGAILGGRLPLEILGEGNREVIEGRTAGRRVGLDADGAAIGGDLDQQHCGRRRARDVVGERNPGRPVRERRLVVTGAPVPVRRARRRAIEWGRRRRGLGVRSRPDRDQLRGEDQHLPRGDVYRIGEEGVAGC